MPSRPSTRQKSATMELEGSAVKTMEPDTLNNMKPEGLNSSIAQK